MLRRFLAVVDRGTVTAAAQQVHLTQPALSRQLRAFERSLGVDLFGREGQRLVLTSSGHQFVPVARDLLARIDQATAFAEALARGAMASITFAAAGTTLRDVIGPFVATWRPDDPIPVVWDEPAAEVYVALARGADLAVGTQAPPDDLETLELVTVPLWAYVRADHRWAGTALGGGAVQLRDLVVEHLLLPPVDHHARRALEVALHASGIGVRTMSELNASDTAQALAAAGRGVAVVSDDPRFDLVPVRILAGRRPVSINLHAAWLPDHHARPQLRVLAERLRQFSSERYASIPS